MTQQAKYGDALRRDWHIFFNGENGHPAPSTHEQRERARDFWAALRAKRTWYQDIDLDAELVATLQEVGFYRKASPCDAGAEEYEEIMGLTQ